MSPDGVSVLIVSARDGDGDEITYSITSGQFAAVSRLEVLA